MRMRDTAEAEIRAEKLKKAMGRRRAAYFCAHTGWGKTEFIKDYFERQEQEYDYISCRDEDFAKKFAQIMASPKRNVVIDDFQESSEEEQCAQAVADAIAGGDEKIKFYILSRCAIPAQLKPFVLTNQIAEFGIDFFMMSAEEIRLLFAENGKEISNGRAGEIKERSWGWFLAVAAMMRHFDGVKSLDEVSALASEDIFTFLDMRIFALFDDNVQSFLMKVGHLPEFDAECAKMVTGRQSVKREIDEVLKRGSFMFAVPPNKYGFYEIFNEYIIQKQHELMESGERRGVYENTALYFVLHGDASKALKYYKAAGDERKMAEILIQNAQNHPGNGQFYKLREYYFALPREVTEKSPDLLCALSMLWSVTGNGEKSEEYYDLLSRLSEKAENKFVRKKALGKLRYLNIALPHRGISDIAELLKSYAGLLASEKTELHEISVTGNMPSVLNGGKDFCQWTKDDRFLYETLKEPAGAVLGSGYGGFAEIALGESLFEKNTDGNFTEALTYLNMGYYEAQACGNIQLEFASLALMARIYACSGKVRQSIDIIEKFRARVDEKEEILSNVDAFLTWLHVLDADYDYVNEWLRNKAPDENSGFCILDRYRYLIKVDAYIMKGDYTEALALLARADEYFVAYRRTYCHIEALILKAIVLYRQQDDGWRGVFEDALEICEEYSFTRVAAKYGKAVLEMMREVEGENHFYALLLENVQRQAAMYPREMQTNSGKKYDFTESERYVLRLLSEGMTNEQMAQIGGITVRGVKFHLSNIYAKLGVKGRAAAIEKCMGEDII